MLILVNTDNLPLLCSSFLLKQSGVAYRAQSYSSGAKLTKSASQLGTFSRSQSLYCMFGESSIHAAKSPCVNAGLPTLAQYSRRGSQAYLLEKHVY